MSDLRVVSLEEREYLIDRLDFVRNQLNLLIQDIKKQIKLITEEVENKVKRRNSLSAGTTWKHTWTYGDDRSSNIFGVCLRCRGRWRRRSAVSLFSSMSFVQISTRHLTCSRCTNLWVKKSKSGSSKVFVLTSDRDLTELFSSRRIFSLTLSRAWARIWPSAVLMQSTRLFSPLRKTWSVCPQHFDYSVSRSY